MQEVYTRVWLRAGRYDPAKGRGMTWLIAIARNLAIDRLRARPEAASDDGLETVQDNAPRAETQLIAKGIDLAARHAVPLNTMRTWLRRSLLKLKECLDQ